MPVPIGFTQGFQLIVSPRVFLVGVPGMHELLADLLLKAFLVDFVVRRTLEVKEEQENEETFKSGRDVRGT
jgi:hypothetical protein